MDAILTEPHLATRIKIRILMNVIVRGSSCAEFCTWNLHHSINEYGQMIVTELVEPVWQDGGGSKGQLPPRASRPVIGRGRAGRGGGGMGNVLSEMLLSLWSLVGQLEASVVLVQLLCCVLLPCSMC